MKNKYELQKELLVRSLEKDDLKKYIDNIIREIYQSFVSNDIDRCEIKKRELNSLLDVLGFKYPFAEIYIHCRCVVIANKIFESLFDRDFSLFNPKNNYDIDFCPEDMFVVDIDEKDDLMIFTACFDDDMNRFMDFVKALPQFKYYFKDEKSIQAYNSRNMIAKVTDFMNDVKEGKYDGYLEVPEDYLIDDEDYLPCHEYCERRHKEAREKGNASSEAIFKN